MGFIEDERIRRERLARENTEESILKRAEEARLSRVEVELEAEKLREKSVAYYKESSIPQLMNELSIVVKGNISSDFEIDPRGFGKLRLSLRWDRRETYEDWDELRRRHPKRGINHEIHGFNRYFVSKSIDIVFYSTGWIQFVARQGVSNEFNSRQWRGKREVEEAALEKAFRIPGEYLEIKRKPQSSGGGPWGGPGMG